jgi:hypothetical protein
LPYDYGNSVDPALLEAFGLDPDVLHLNHGAFGVAPVVVRRAAAPGATVPNAIRTASTASRSAGWWRRRGSARRGSWASTRLECW